MLEVGLQTGQLVYVRSYSTRRAAVAEFLTVVRQASREWGQVRLGTDLHDWDEGAAPQGKRAAAGDLLEVETYRLEPLRLD